MVVLVAVLGCTMTVIRCPDPVALTVTLQLVPLHAALLGCCTSVHEAHAGETQITKIVSDRRRYFTLNSLIAKPSNHRGHEGRSHCTTYERPPLTCPVLD